MTPTQNTLSGLLPEYLNWSQSGSFTQVNLTSLKNFPQPSVMLKYSEGKLNLNTTVLNRKAPGKSGGKTAVTFYRNTSQRVGIQK